MPLRSKQLRGSLQLTSVTTTFFAPASWQSRTSAATSSGLVLAACSGARSQPMFGLITTTSPRETNRVDAAEDVERRLDEALGFAALRDCQFGQAADRAAPRDCGR